MRRNGIEPMVTIYHWDLPQSLQDLGGWTNPLSVDWYIDYARICFQLFGKSVKYWFTFNEPKQICHYAYAELLTAPAIFSPEGEYLCAHHVLLAHASAWHMYKKQFKSSQKGTKCYKVSRWKTVFLIWVGIYLLEVFDILIDFRCWTC